MPTRKVLVADDDPIFRLKVAEHLKSAHGLTVVGVENGSQALAAVKRAQVPFDIVITDLAMPDMDGIEFLGFLSAIGYLNPIVLVSGETPLTVKMARIIAQEKGLDVIASLSKPVSTKMLDQLISDHFRLSEVA